MLRKHVVLHAPKLEHWLANIVGKHALGELKKYAQPEHQIALNIQPITQPLQKWAALLLGTTSLLVGIPFAFIMPFVPTTPFVLVGLFCLARTSSRFRGWLCQQPAFRIAITVVHVQNGLLWRGLRRCIQYLAGNKPLHLNP